MTKFGVRMFLTDESIGPIELARSCEKMGFESLFLPEHLHIPAVRTSPYPQGGPLPREYSRTLDPFVALSAAAAVTSTLVLGFGICLIAQRDPITTAKAIASLDHLSNGRTMLGVGPGWNREEMRNHGTEPSTRYARMKEGVEAMKEIWSNDEASYQGTHVRFDQIWSWPKPVQGLGPPVLIGGSGPGAIGRVLEYGDGWLPVGKREVESIPRGMAELARQAAELGRAVPPTTVYGAQLDHLETYVSLGVERCVFAVPTMRETETLDKLHELSDRARAYGLTASDREHEGRVSR